jgi:hypothetical protein
MIFNPIPNYEKLLNHFSKSSKYPIETNKEVIFETNIEVKEKDIIQEKVFVHNEVSTIEPCDDCDVWMKSTNNNNPIIIVKDDDIYVNMYSMSWVTLATAFKALYGYGLPGYKLHNSILYGEGYSSQRVEISKDLEIVLNKMSRPSIIKTIPIPKWSNWYRPIMDLPGNESMIREVTNFAYYGKCESLNCKFT